jgi:uncharacterized membrane protein YhhN
MPGLLPSLPESLLIFSIDIFSLKRFIEGFTMKKQGIFFFLIILAELVAVAIHNRIAEFVFKPLIVIWLLGWFVLQTTAIRSPLKKWIILALLLSWAGDVLLMFQDDNSLFFLTGLSSFLLAHLFYILFFHFVRIKENVAGRWLFLMIVIAYCVGIIFILSPHLGDMVWPVRIYAAVISCMFMLAMHMLFIKNKRAGQDMMIGAMLFIISDSLLAINKFYYPFQLAGIFVMATYGLAQFFITYGAIRYLSSVRKE